MGQFAGMAGMFGHQQFVAELLMVERRLNQLWYPSFVLSTRDGIHDENNSFHAAKLLIRGRIILIFIQYFIKKKDFLEKKNMLKKFFVPLQPECLICSFSTPL